MRQSLFWLGGLLGLPLLSFAQSTPATPRFYIGAGANLLAEAPFNFAGDPKLLAPSLTAGVQFSPRLALQVSPSYHWKTDSYTFRYFFLGSETYATQTTKYKYVMAPILVRYTFTAPVTRFHFDGLVGITVVHGTFDDYQHNQYLTSYNSNALTKASATLGPAARFTLSPNVELTASSLVSAIIGDNYAAFSDRLFLNVAVGAHYTFGQL